MVYRKISPLFKHSSAVLNQLKNISAVIRPCNSSSTATSATDPDTSPARPAVNFVPEHAPSTSSDVERLQEFLQKYSTLFVITGAGLSTESGIPDYRSVGTGLYARTNHRPMKHQEFLSSESARKRYWARNYFGWTYFSSRKPNIGHHILQQWENDNIISCIVTQNVDGLHRKAGSKNLVELHGSAYTVNCLDCGGQCDRVEFQRKLDRANEGFMKGVPGADDVMQIRPDGDIYLDASLVAKFEIPECDVCGSRLMQPDIVFFGANVKKQKVDALYAQLAECDSILVIGSSLQVFSALRFVLRGQEMGIPIALLTLGETRADSIATLKVNARIGEVLPLVKLDSHR